MPAVPVRLRTLALALNCRLGVGVERPLGRRAGLQYAAQVGEEAESLSGVVVGLRGVHGHRVVAVLGVVHRDVGVAHQGGEVLAVLREEGDPDRPAHVQRQPVERHRLGQRLNHPVGQLPRLTDVGQPGHHDGELVTAQPGDHLWSGLHVGEPGADLDQQPVAHGMPEGVVDVLETVQVDQQERELPVGFTTGGPLGMQVHLLGHLGQQSLAVGQPGQRVGGGEVLLFVCQPRHPVDGEERHQHQRDQRGADPRRRDQHRREQQQRAGGEQLEAEALADGGPPAVPEPQPHRPADQPVVDDEPGQRGTADGGHVGPVQPPTGEDRARAELDHAVGGSEGTRVLADVERRAPRRVPHPPTRDDDAHRLHHHRRAETPAEQDREGEAGGREHRRRLPAPRRHERARVADHGERGHRPERHRQLGQLAGERREWNGGGQRGDRQDAGDEGGERCDPSRRKRVAWVGDLHHTSRPTIGVPVRAP
ncbi:hypothetical protein ONO86_03585 [Micromonospora noduli]|nr:hypothetical protein ONO86_03585 [Micromonospora noduli]